MSVMSAQGRRPRSRYTDAQVAELRRLADWFDGIADDYAAATGMTTDRATLVQLSLGARDARRRAALLRGRVADR